MVRGYREGMSQRARVLMQARFAHGYTYVQPHFSLCSLFYLSLPRVCLRRHDFVAALAHLPERLPETVVQRFVTLRQAHAHMD